MKIEVDEDRGIVLKEVYSGISMETSEGNKIGICMRDDTFEINVMPKGVHTGNWWRPDMQTGLFVSDREECSDEDLKDILGGHACYSPGLERKLRRYVDKMRRQMVDSSSMRKQYLMPLDSDVTGDYRLLRQEENIQEGDQIWNFHFQEWCNYSSYVPGVDRMEKNYNYSPRLNLIRRKVSKEEQQACDPA